MQLYHLAKHKGILRLSKGSLLVRDALPLLEEAIRDPELRVYLIDSQECSTMAAEDFTWKLTEPAELRHFVAKPEIAKADWLQQQEAWKRVIEEARQLREWDEAQDERSDLSLEFDWRDDGRLEVTFYGTWGLDWMTNIGDSNTLVSVCLTAKQRAQLKAYLEAHPSASD